MMFRHIIVIGFLSIAAGKIVNSGDPCQDETVANGQTFPAGDCERTYYRCVNGRTIEYECAPGAVFDPDKNPPRCDHIKDVPVCLTKVNCSDDTFDDFSYTKSDDCLSGVYYTCKSGIEVQSTCRTGLIFITTLQQCTRKGTYDCTETSVNKGNDPTGKPGLPTTATEARTTLTTQDIYDTEGSGILETTGMPTNLTSATTEADSDEEESGWSETTMMATTTKKDTDGSGFSETIATFTTAMSMTTSVETDVPEGSTSSFVTTAIMPSSEKTTVKPEPPTTLSTSTTTATPNQETRTSTTTTTTTKEEMTTTLARLTTTTEKELPTYIDSSPTTSTSTTTSTTETTERETTSEPDPSTAVSTSTTTTTTTTEKDPCKTGNYSEGEMFPYDDCDSTYYQCVNGKQLERECAPETAFDMKTGVCNHLYEIPACSEGDIDCGDDTYEGYSFTESKDCEAGTYYTCSSGIKEELQCPVGLRFQTSLQQCTAASDSDCNGSRSSTIPNSLLLLICILVNFLMSLQCLDGTTIKSHFNG